MSHLKPILERREKNTSQIHHDPLINRIFRNRDVSGPEEVEYKLSKLIPPNLMKGMAQGTEILVKHIMADSKILIVGDYDADGATATVIAVDGLQLCGAKNVEFLIPDRVEHGYGLQRTIVELAGKSKPDLIVTVDNGITSFDGVAAVKDLEHPCEILVTDHHLAVDGGAVPDADGIINPNQPGCTFPSKNIAGCGVMLYTIMALKSKMENEGYFEKLNMQTPRLISLLDVAALGTVADVVTLDYNNRIIIQNGLNLINRGAENKNDPTDTSHLAFQRMRPGLTELLKKKKKEIGKVVSMDFGFAVGPCLNAAGRLEDMSLGIQCLLEKDPHKAEQLAQRLVDLNEQRKEIEGEMVEDAVKQLDGFSSDKDGVCIYNPHWHEGVVGIVASRIKDRLNRPIICFTDTHEAEKVRENIKEAELMNASKEEIAELNKQLMECDQKGSARSIKGLHLKHVIDKINSTNPEVLKTSFGIPKFGGHAMAAGISIRIGEYERFQKLFDEGIKEQITNEMKIGAIEVDVKNVSPEHMTMQMAETINHIGPWGQNFEFPTFSKDFIVDGFRIVGEKHLQLTLKCPETNTVFKAISFGCVEKGEVPTQIGNKIESVFKLSINEWNGNRNLQLMVDFFQDEQYILQKQMKVEEQENTNVTIQGAEALQRLETSIAKKNHEDDGMTL